MNIEKLIVDGLELSVEDSYFIINDLYKNKIIKDPKEAQEYVKNHKREYVDDVMILRNPNFEGVHFSFSAHHKI